MPKHIGYFTDSLGNQPWYRCIQCDYDTFAHESITQHVSFHTPAWTQETGFGLDKVSLSHKRIGIGLLTWNTAEASALAARAIAQETVNLRSLGVDSLVIWADNGSTDGTQEQVARELPQNATHIQNPENWGQSKARNQIIAEALGRHCDYLLMVDGDVEVIRGSVAALASYLEDWAPFRVGCVGLYSRNCTTNSHDQELARECLVIEPFMVTDRPHIAWTNYGMFRREVLEACKFEENGPFSGPGWGLEDDDYYMQMAVAGWKCVNTRYFRHLHRSRHSSVGNLGLGLAAKVFAERKAFMLNKWRGVPQVAEHLRVLQNQSISMG